MLFQKVADGGLQAAEAEIKIPLFRHRPGELMTCGIPLLGEAVHLHATGISETEKLCRFVKGLPGGIVQRATEHSVSPGTLHLGQFRMPAAHEQRDVGWDFLRPEEGREKMPLEMVEGEVRNTQGHGEALGVGGSDEKRGSKSGA